jgi:hypothetical protein
VLRLSTDELVRLAPRLRSYLTTPTPTWPGIDRHRDRRFLPAHRQAGLAPQGFRDPQRAA